jgi:1-acyl-sn-glycerol-3-phosphate acyltransferase
MALPRTLSTLLWSPLNLLQGIATALWGALWISIALVAALVAGPRPALALARKVWGPGQIAIGGARFGVVGREHVAAQRAQLFVANHQSWLDIPVLFCALPVPLHFLAKRELGAVPFLGWYIRAMGMVFVDRDTPRRASASVDGAARLLASGRSVLSFPEGTRSRDGRTGRFKSGAFGAALAAGAPVVPVALVGTGAVLPAGGFRVRPGTVEVRIGAPIDSAAFAPGDRAGLARAAESAVRRLLGEAPAAGE